MFKILGDKTKTQTWEILCCITLEGSGAAAQDKKYMDPMIVTKQNSNATKRQESAKTRKK